MAIKAANNPPLGMPLFEKAYDATDPNLPALGTIISALNDATGSQDEYIWLISPAAIVATDEVDWDASTMQATEVAAPNGGAVAIVASGATQRAWFRLKRRPQAAV